jgi:hypothetical protein
MSSDKLNTQHPDYTASVQRWARGRDAYAGGDAVKAKGTAYLPPLESMDVEHGDYDGYKAYVKRAVWYGATARTVDGLAGAVFQKPAEWTGVSQKEQDQLEDVTLDGVDADLFMLLATRNVFLTGRSGILVDVAGENGAGRPYWSEYYAENILNWYVDRINGVPVLTLVVLQEMARKNPDNPFDTEVVPQLRILTLEGGVYVQTTYRQVDGSSEKWQQTDRIVPMRRGTPLSFIPFYFIGATNTTPEVEKPPLIDLIDMNYSHYRTSADLEHGLHFVGTPQLVLVGGLNQKGEPVKFGSGRALLLPKGSDAKILQADGNLMGALEKAEERKRKLMATLGARMLEDAPIVERDTATAVALRHSGEHATVRTVSHAVERGFTNVLRCHLWWLGSAALPADGNAAVVLNKDFLATKMNPNELRELVAALQAEAISHETFWLNLERGGIARPDTSSEEELEQIEEEAPEDASMPNEQDPNAAPGGEVSTEGNPYRIEKRNGKFMVVKAATGEVVAGGDHGTDEAKAKRHRAALEKAAAKEKV